MYFGPYFFQDQDPKLILIGLAEKRLSYLVNRHEVIDENLFDFSVDLDGDFVQA